jgi:HAD superfamily hydrolase (TIGR01509 family)
VPVELVIFDCDGVLIDSEPIVNRAHAETLAACGLPYREDELLDRFCGTSDKDMLAAIEAEQGRALPADYAALVAAIVEQEYRSSLKPIDGVAAVLAMLSTPVCVASSSVPAKIRLGLEATGLLGYFEPHLFSAAAVSRGKPAPDLFLYAAGRMGVAPRHCAVVEDSLPGVAAAVAADMTCIGFTGGGHCRPGHAARLAAQGASRVIERMADLPATLHAL